MQIKPLMLIYSYKKTHKKGVNSKAFNAEDVTIHKKKAFLQKKLTYFLYVIGLFVIFATK